MKKSVSGNSKKRIIYILAGMLLLGIACYQLIDIGVQYQQGKNVYARFWNTAKEKDDTDGTRQKAKKQADTSGESDYRDFKIDFDALKKVNEDIIGWIRFDKNGINYPVLQGRDNEEYLSILPDKTKNASGSIFMDYLCTPDFTDSHTIIYGHNMKNLSMFGKLKQYRTTDGYYEENRYFTIYMPDRIFRYEIFGWYEADVEDSVYQVGFTDEDAFGDFVDQMLVRRYRDTEVTADKRDKVVTLSTCSVTGKRFVVHGKLTDSIDETG